MSRLQVALPNRPLPILMYHQVAPPPERGTPFRGLTVAPEVFARHMRVLKMLGYRGLAMRDLMPYLLGERDGKVFGLTFDDGYADVFRNVLPVLHELDFTATNYCVAGHAAGSNHWDAEKGVPGQNLMSEKQMRGWVAAGHEIGSHTLDHVDLTKVVPLEAERQIRESRERLEQILGSAVTAFCYPYGHYSADHVRMVFETGYVSATTTLRGRVKGGGEMGELPRVTMTRSTHLFGLWQKIATSYEDRRGKQ